MSRENPPGWIVEYCPPTLPELASWLEARAAEYRQSACELQFGVDAWRPLGADDSDPEQQARDRCSEDSRRNLLAWTYEWAANVQRWLDDRRIDCQVEWPSRFEDYEHADRTLSELLRFLRRKLNENRAGFHIEALKRLIGELKQLASPSSTGHAGVAVYVALLSVEQFYSEDSPNDPGFCLWKKVRSATTLDGPEFHDSLIGSGASQRLPELVKWAQEEIERISKAGKPVVCTGDTPEQQGRWLVGELRDLSGLTATPFRKYVRRAGYDPPDRGKKNFRFTDTQAREILECIRNNCSEKRIKAQCNEALQEHLKTTS